MTKPLISYYGGKKRISGWICQHIPKHTVYVEPFCGGAAIFFRKPQPIVTNAHNYREVINDTNKALITLYRVAANKDLQEEFIRRLNLTPYSRYLYTESVKQNRSDYKDMDDLDIAISFYINANCSFAGKLNGGFGTNVFSANLPSSFYSKIESLPEITKRLRLICIECDDALKVIKRWDSSQTFFYLDPPYVNTHQGHYKGYSQEDFESLLDTIKEIKGSFLLSHYSNHGIEIPDDWEVFHKDTYCYAKRRAGYDRSEKKDESSQNRERTEVLYRKLASEPREEIKKLYATGNYDCFPGPGWLGEPANTKDTLF